MSSRLSSQFSLSLNNPRNGPSSEPGHVFATSTDSVLLNHTVINGDDIQSMDVAWLRRQIAFVGQEPVLFDATIGENILFGLETAATDMGPEAREKLVVEAAQKAHAHNFICALPQGYDTPVGEKGARLSGGQRQRIAIARALVRNPSILLLDEATSALDSQSEAAVLRALEDDVQSRTTIVVAHRLSTIRDADLIIVMAGGRIVEQGTHLELLDQHGVYAGLVAQQSVDDTSEKPEVVGLDRDVDQYIDIPVDYIVGDTPKEAVDLDLEKLEHQVVATDVTGSNAGPRAKARDRVQLKTGGDLRDILALIYRMSSQNLSLLVVGLSCSIIAGLGVPG